MILLTLSYVGEKCLRIRFVIFAICRLSVLGQLLLICSDCQVTNICYWTFTMANSSLKMKSVTLTVYLQGTQRIPLHYCLWGKTVCGVFFGVICSIAWIIFPIFKQLIMLKIIKMSLFILDESSITCSSFYRAFFNNAPDVMRKWSF